jgi:immune inhibitor A
VHLPDKVVTIDHGVPYAGEHFYASDDGDNVDNRMWQEFDLPSGAGLTARVRYLLETDWDYAYLIASSDGGQSWTNVSTNLSTTSNPNGQNFGNGITGDSAGAWVELTADLSAFSGPTLIGFHHWTDFFTTPDMQGPFDIDEIAISGYPTDGAESDIPWTFEPLGGFRAVKGMETFTYFNAYLAEYRQYRGFDEALRTGPYTFVTQTLVHSFPYQDGLLIWYWDGSQTDNNVSVHQGHGLILPIDARPKLMMFDTNSYWSPAVQSYDATFGTTRTDPITLFSGGQSIHYPSRRPMPTFDDNKQYWDPNLPLFGSVLHPDTNTQIRVLNMNPRTGVMQVMVRPTN